MGGGKGRDPPADSKILKFCHNELLQNTYIVSILTIIVTITANPPRESD